MIPFSIYFLLLFLASATGKLNNTQNNSLYGCPSTAHLPPSTFKVLVPNRTAFTQFVDCSDPTYLKGFSVDVFRSALSILPAEVAWENVTYHCYNFDSDDENFDEMVECLTTGSFDAVVGDITIGANRSKNYASFTQPYLDSGVVILAPMVGLRTRFPGVFFAPFTAQMWGSIFGFAMFTGCVLWLLEQKSHPEFRHGPLKQRIHKSLWYTFPALPFVPLISNPYFPSSPPPIGYESSEMKMSCTRSRPPCHLSILESHKHTGSRFVAQLLLFLKRETLGNLFAKAVLLGWIAFMLVLGSAYIASFSAILTVHKLAPDELSIQTVLNESYHIGYQKGSIVFDYLTGRLGIPLNRLKPLKSTEQYLEALSKGQKSGGVGVIMDEAPYVNLFLSGLSTGSCNYFIVGSKLTSEGLGFAFPRVSTTTSRAFSKAILNLSESGELLKLQVGAQIIDYQCPTQVQSTRLDLISSEWLFLLLGLMLFGSIAMFFATEYTQKYSSITKFSRVENADIDEASAPDFDDSVSIRDRAPSPHHLLRDEVIG